MNASHPEHPGGIRCFLADLLYSSKLSLSEAARRVGKARTTLIRWRDNTAEEFEFETLARLCALFVLPSDQQDVSPLPLSLLLEYRAEATPTQSRSIPVVQALPVLPPHSGRHQIICTLKARLKDEGISYEDLARQLGQPIQAETLSEVVRGRTHSISRRTLTLLCHRYRSIDNLFVFDPLAQPHA